MAQHTHTHTHERGGRREGGRSNLTQCLMYMCEAKDVSYKGGNAITQLGHFTLFLMALPKEQNALTASTGVTCPPLGWEDVFYKKSESLLGF